VSKHEDRVVKGRFLSPPAGPLALAPGSTYRAEHVPAHDGGTHTRSPPREGLCRSSGCRCGWRTPIHGAGCLQYRVDCRDSGGARRRNRRARSRSCAPAILAPSSPSVRVHLTGLTTVQTVGGQRNHRWAKWPRVPCYRLGPLCGLQGTQIRFQAAPRPEPSWVMLPDCFSSPRTGRIVLSLTPGRARRISAIVNLGAAWRRT
jgi:hypothetical protein